MTVTQISTTEWQDTVNAATVCTSKDASVCIVTADQSSRDSLQELITPMKLLVRTFDGPEQFLESISPSLTGCVICDVYMEGMTGLELQSLLSRKRQTLPIIFLSTRASIPMVVRAMRNGAIGFLEKPFREDELSLYVREAIAVDREARVHLARAEDYCKCFSQLTNQEKEILDAIYRGHTNRQIANELDISLRSVESRRQQLFRKMGSNCLSDLLTRYFEFGELARGGHASFPRLAWSRADGWQI